MQLEDGKYYRTRDGRKAGPAKDVRGEIPDHVTPESVAFVVPLNGHPATYHCEGWRFYAGREDPKDLVAEWPNDAIMLSALEKIANGKGDDGEILTMTCARNIARNALNAAGARG